MPQDAGGTEHRENIVAQCGQFDMLLRCERQQQDTKRKEQEIDRCEGKTIGVHILLGVFQTLAGKVFLHHVLIEAGHYDGDKDSAKKLFREMLCAVPVAELEDAEMRAGLQGLHHASEIQLHLVFHLPDDHDQHGDQA